MSRASRHGTDLVMSRSDRVRPAAVAGFFYPGDAAELRTLVAELLSSAAPAPPRGPAPKAIIAPHAGYVYSGPIAASSFAALAPAAPELRRVVLIGPSHRVRVRGVALPAAESFETPLGAVPVDGEAVADLARLPQVEVDAAAHADEHSLEVELPFLQLLCGPFQLVPLLVGQADGEQVAEVLERSWGGPETAIVVSSDLSHYLPAAEAERVDRGTASQILALGGPLHPHQACGALPINGLLVAARRQGLVPRLLDLRHSGDTAGDRSQVVGYGAWAFHATG
ncbi:MAG TPA: AmmeMemoRadiSam system protein B [Thermoanaerobaculia bacterium]|nr:AmmeMemoRadiSam system protein B [Thermoanaerobaculia bacterium]